MTSTSVYRARGGYGPGGYTGVWYRVGIREGAIPGTQPAARGGSYPAKRAPEVPCRGTGVGGVGPGRPLHPRPPTPGPEGLPGPAPLSGACSPVNAASGPIRARFDLILVEYSQNREVSPKSVEKAYRSPYFQNELGKSPLEIPRFPFSPAFSAKELMGQF